MGKDFEAILKEKEERIENALNIAWSYGQTDSAHHKMWVIDQMVRALCGNNEDYGKWIAAYEAPLDDADYYVWDKGIAP